MGHDMSGAAAVDAGAQIVPANLQYTTCSALCASISGCRSRVTVTVGRSGSAAPDPVRNHAAKLVAGHSVRA
eukprot:3050220-Rhodomonas_salina.2